MTNRRGPWRLLASAFALACVAVVGLATPAQAVTVFGPYRIVNKAGYCLDGSTANGIPRYLAPTACPPGSSVARWYLALANENADYQLVDVATGRCLDGGGAQFATSYMSTCEPYSYQYGNQNPNKLWLTDPAPDGSGREMLFNQATGLYLDGGGAAPYLRGVNNPPNNTWLYWTITRA